MSGESPARSEAEAMIAEAKKALWVMVGLLAVLWVVQIFNSLDGYDLGRDLGIEARDPASLPEIFSAPFMHSSWGHIEGNSGPLFVFGFLAAYRGVKKWLSVSLLIIVASGLGVWFTSPSDSVTVGASGLVFGYFGYIIVRGLFDRHPIDIVLGVVMALCFAYQFTSLLPTDERVSWQGHLFGFAGGIIGGWLFRDRKPKSVATPDAATTLLPKDLG
ncbi:rhomboid family intramembrane serine protease [Amycolatopsis sp. SID8362]|uniref:rhomboid family intramembrane serine protease n=1 Tax=Amycolatopsis sp. SID8362 TaxID=2690346 RepID=UPI001370CBB3|nr:rhomboid family intramembrane serine protease [Amycolatopsis sp. SID8362]NBH11609.1 rhomboid family intramembrane serine protease [Amycolatopsis sp. SID8362]NED48301.1 rhomboid family intramembrane serine protease [Amycolatopsis sp. SID8362]